MLSDLSAVHLSQRKAEDTSLEIVFAARQGGVSSTVELNGSLAKTALLEIRTETGRKRLLKALSAALDPSGRLTDEYLAKATILGSLSERGQKRALEKQKLLARRSERETDEKLHDISFKGVDENQQQQIEPKGQTKSRFEVVTRRRSTISKKAPPSFDLNGRPPEIVDLPTYIEAHRWDDNEIRLYSSRKWRGGQELSADIEHELDFSSISERSTADSLFANNREARIRFTEIAVRHISSENYIGGADKSYFVTIMPARFAVSEKNAVSFNHQSIQNWVRSVLPGFDFIGMVEAALFESERSDNSADGGSTISWHVHLHVWNTSYSRLNKRLAEITRSYPAFVVGRPSTRCDVSHSKSELIRRTCYMLKVPLKQYNVYRAPDGEVTDPAIGEVVARPDVQKRPLRSGQRVRMCHVMGDRFIDQLFFGQGKGTTIRRAIVAEALKKIRDANRRADLSRRSFLKRKRRHETLQDN